MKLPQYGIALTAPGLERITSQELSRIGLEEDGRLPGRIRFGLHSDPVSSLLKANLWLRTCDRVLMELASAQVEDFGRLYDVVREVPWELYVGADEWPVVEKVRTKDSKLSAQTSIQSIVHKAALDRLCERHHRQRMNATGTRRGIRIYLDSNWCTLGLDTSGEALSRRGYRLDSGVAPLKESVAAGLLFLSGWSRRLDFLDPFCGSGTIAIEAALFALNKAPGLDRTFALESMPVSRQSGLGTARSDARRMIKNDAQVLILASDADPSVLVLAKANAQRAGCADLIRFSRAKAEESTPPGPKGVLLCNPPYGERLGTEEEALELYKSLAPLRPRFQDWGMGFMTAREDFGTWFGARGSARKIMNGAEEQWFHWYPGRSK